ncbi:MAG: glycosyltransferase [Planctomycetes bacterium]|nr:glycosyltransferase [Planctomycetota bacterium]
MHSLSVGGLERTLISLVSRSDPDRVKHVVCTMRRPGSLANELPTWIECESLDIKGTNRLAALPLAKVLRRHQPHIVHARNWNTWTDTMLACRLARRRPPVFGFHGLESPTGFAANQKRRARWLRLKSAPFTAVSHAGAAQLQHQLSVPTTNVCVLPNGVDTSRFAPATPQTRLAARRALAIADHEFVIVTVGALVPVKDHATAIQALHKHVPKGRSCRFLVVGDGPLAQTLEHQAKKGPTHVRCEFLGRRDDVPDVLHAADLFVLSSRYEQMSNALLEAMAVGLPVVATDVGDSARMVEHERSGLITPPADVDALGRAVARMIDNPELRRRFGERARRRVVEEFGVDKMVDRYTSFYQSLLGNCDRKEATSCAASRE